MKKHTFGQTLKEIVFYPHDNFSLIKVSEIKIVLVNPMFNGKEKKDRSRI